MDVDDRTSSAESSGARTNLKRPRRAWPLALVLLAAAGSGIWWLQLRASPAGPPPAAAQPAVAVAEPDAPVEPPIPPLPPVAEADGRVREALRSLAALSPWLDTEDLARRFVAAVHSVADDESPRQSLSFVEVPGRFAVLEREGRSFVDPKGYARYDAIARGLGALDARVAAEAFRELEPLFEAAHREIGRPGTGFEQTLARAITKLLAVPLPEGEVELASEKLLFGFADTGLEALSPAQKHLLRMGPENMRLVQGKLREISRELELPVSLEGSSPEEALPER